MRLPSLYKFEASFHACEKKFKVGRSRRGVAYESVLWHPACCHDHDAAGGRLRLCAYNGSAATVA